MRTLNQLAACLLTAVAAASLTAQGQTWIVDAAGGPGSHFTNIPPALQAAQDGDTMLVRTGTYDGGSITRGISILADAGATVKVRMTDGSVFFPGYAFEVDGLPAGKTVVLEGFGPVLPPGGLGSLSVFIRLNACSGRVHCDNLAGDLMGTGSSMSWPGLSIINCAHVSVHDCTLRHGQPVSALQSTVSITDSAFEGQSAFSGFGQTSSSRPALSAASSQLTVARSRLEGGSGAFLGIPYPPSSAIEMTNGTLTIAGGSEAALIAGTSFLTSPPPRPAVGGTGGTVTADPRVTLMPSGGAPPRSTSACRSVPCRRRSRVAVRSGSTSARCCAWAASRSRPPSRCSSPSHCRRLRVCGACPSPSRR